MCPGCHLAGIGTQVLITSRSCCRHIENLILDILIAQRIGEADAVVEEVKIGTNLPVVCILGFQIWIKFHVVGYISLLTAKRIADWRVEIHTTAVCWHVHIVVVEHASLTYLSQRCAQLTIGEDVIAFQARELCEDPA